MFNIRNVNRRNFDNNAEYISEVKSTLTLFSNSYPQIEKWYDSKVIPGISSGDRSLILAYWENTLAGFTILKDDIEEKKICTFFIYPEYRGDGLAQKLFENSFSELQTRKPLITIPEKSLSMFKKYIKQYKFELGDSLFTYQKDAKEYIFNGLLH